MPRFFLPVRLSVVLVALLAALLGGADARQAHATAPPSTRAARAEGETLTFAYRDEALLFPWQSKGVAAYLPPGLDPGKPVPLLVFLHGTNPDGHLHLWMGGGGKDMRPTLRDVASTTEARFVVVAPSQTRSAASGRGLWGDLDLLMLLAATQRELAGRARVDLDRVYVLGHSGAGCNPTGGIVGAARGVFTPAGVAALDTCLDAEMGVAMARRPASVKLWTMWQAASWPREPEAFRRAVEENQPEGAWFQMDQRPAGDGNPHDALVPDALRVLLAAWAVG